MPLKTQTATEKQKQNEYSLYPDHKKINFDAEILTRSPPLAHLDLISVEEG